MSILILACAVIGFLPPAAYFTFRYQQVKVSYLFVIKYDKKGKVIAVASTPVICNIFCYTFYTQNEEIFPDPALIYEKKGMSSTLNSIL